MTDPNAPGRPRGQRERHWLALLIAAATTGVLALGTGFGLREVAAVEERARTTVETASALLREHAAAVFGASDTLLRQAVRLAGASGAPPPPTRETHEFLRTLADTVPSALAIWFGDADGLATVTSREFPAPPLNAAERDYFRVHREGADVGVFVTALPDNRYRGQPVILLSRAVRDAGGRMTGFATTNIDRDQLRSAYRRQGGEFSLGVTLARTDGTVLLREPVVETITLPARVPSTDADVAWPDGFGRWTSGFDGVRWLGRVAPVEGMPLVMSVAVPVAEVAAARRAVAMRFAAATGLGLALVGGFGWLAWRGAGRLERQVADRTADLSAALAARDLLIREINHRVMNTLALASSMVRLQRRRAGEDAVAAALLVTERRLSALANVHLQLHRSDAVEWVAMDAYLDDLARHFGEAAGEVTVVAEADPMRMRTEAAVKVGIVTAELVLNALKHAFEPDAAGRIRVDLRRSGEGWRLSVADDGRGLPPDGAAPGGLGMTVVSALANDLDAEVRIERPPRGACIVLDVPHAGVLAPD